MKEKARHVSAPGKDKGDSLLYTPYRGRVQVTLRKSHSNKAKHCLRCARDFRRLTRVFREKRAKNTCYLAFQVGLYSSGDSIMVWAVNIII